MTADLHRSDAPTLPLARTTGSGDTGASTDDPVRALPEGTRLAEFELLRVLGAGGFGIVYLARDHTLLRQVAIKEYLPGQFARREADGTVTARSEADRSTLAMGLRSFLREARLLAGFDHPALVKVLRFWEANGTAYIAMPYYAGRTLKDARRAMPAPPDERWLRALLDPLLAALEVLHAADVCHRDLSPDNVLLLEDGRPLLLDFGSARLVLGDRTQALTAVFKPSFAAIEQYGETPGLRQGPWTDLYALGGVVHFLITGAPPTPAAVRAVHDGAPHALLASAAALGYSPAFMQAIDWALRVRPDDRPASVPAFRAALEGRLVPPGVSVAAPEESATAAPGVEPRADPPARVQTRGARRTWIAVAGAALALLVALGVARQRVGPLRAQSMAAALQAKPSTPMVAAAPLQTAMPIASPNPGATQANATPTPDEAAAGGGQPSAGSPALPGREPRPKHHAAAMRRAGSERAEVPSDRLATPAPPTEPAPSPDPASLAEGPRQACGNHGFWAKVTCYDRMCREPAWHSSADCAAFRERVQAARQRALSE
jgi:hypothetical protein